MSWLRRWTNQLKLLQKALEEKRGNRITQGERDRESHEQKNQQRHAKGGRAWHGPKPWADQVELVGLKEMSSPEGE